MLAVAAENRCWYCQTAHSAFGRAEGISAGQVERILAGDDEGLGQGDRLAVAFARDLARRQFRSRDEGLYAELLSHFTEAQRASIESTAQVMNMANRMGNTFDAARARLAGRCLEVEASPLDQAIISGIFLPGAAMVAPLVGVQMAINWIKE